MAKNVVPVVDFSSFNLKRNEPDQTSFQQLIDDVHQAFSTIIGFVYLINTGIPATIVANTFSKSMIFFSKPLKEKALFQRTGDDNFGYVGIEQEGLNPDREHKDLKEAFNFIPVSKEFVKKVSSSDVSPGMVEVFDDLFTYCCRLHQRILEIIGRGLKLEDPMMFVKAHHLLGKEGNLSCIRSLCYPPIIDYPTKEGQVRCGEHSDYGGITLLFQDEVGGLEVRNLDGEYVPATPIEGAVIINIGDLMQRWTADKLVSTKYRVLMPYDEIRMKQSRQSVVFFGHPDNEEKIICIDGSNKYPPIGSVEYLYYRFGVTY